ncbi:DUF1330 domain-containing protein [Streptosporangium sp. NPDC004379]|uniref:DUF1330 domain-containing protein n=1 Tax=Streptosporangium sp. NPDC004379 TaxID=3366189 RepID=UPI00369B58A8
MTAYAIAHLHRTEVGPEITEYLERIQDTLDPFSGRFVIHGPPAEVLEGTWPGALIAISFPGMAEARAWYDSPAYREILPLRTRNADGDTILIDGVPEGHLATDVLKG